MNAEQHLVKVLCIEDNPANMMLIHQLLKRYPQYLLLEAGSAEEGLDIARQEMPEIVLMDINLPGMNGFEALAVLIQEGLTEKMKVVALSANALVNDVSKGKEEGFDYYLTKPVDFKELIATIQEIVDGLS